MYSFGQLLKLDLVHYVHVLESQIAYTMLFLGSTTSTLNSQCTVYVQFVHTVLHRVLNCLFMG